MTELLEHAVEVVRVLPSGTQDAIARMVLALVGDDLSVVELSADEEASFAESFARADRGAFAGTTFSLAPEIRLVSRNERAVDPAASTALIRSLLIVGDG